MKISSRKYLSEWIFNIIKPCCIVYSSNTARDIISKNSLSPSEFLRPFGDFQYMTITSPCDNTQITSFKLDFIDKENFFSIPKDQFHLYIKALLKHPDIYPKWKASQLKYSYRKVDEIDKIQKYYAFPWCNAFEKTVFELLKCQKTEMYQQPIANVYMCSIEEDVSIISELAQYENIPQLIKDNYYIHPNINLLIVLIDKLNETSIDINKTKLLFEQQYRDSHYVVFMEINKGNKVNNDEMWKNYINYIDLYGPAKRSNSNNSMNKQHSHNSILTPDSPNKPIALNSMNSSSPKLILYDEEEEREDDIKYGSHISNEEIAHNKQLLYEFFVSYALNRISNTMQQYTTELETKTKKGFFSFLTSSKETKNEYDSENVYKLNKQEQYLYYLIIINFYFRNYTQALLHLVSLDMKMKDKSKLHNHFLLEIKSTCKFLVGEKILLREGFIFEIFKNYLEDNNFIIALRFLIIIIKQYETKTNFDKKNPIDSLIKIYKKYLKLKSIPNNDSNSETFLYKVYCAMIWEKKAICNLLNSAYKHPNNVNKRNFALKMFNSGNYYKEVFYKENPFLLHSYGNVISILNSKSSLIFETDENALSSFSSLKEEIYKVLSQVCDDMKLCEESFIFSRLSLELSAHIQTVYKLKGNCEQLIEQTNQPFIMNYYVKNLKDVKNHEYKLMEFLNYKDLLALNIIDVDNTSLYVIEHQDEEIAKRFPLSSPDDLQNYKTRKNNNNKSLQNWVSYFNKYAQTDTKQRYVHLDEKDIKVLKYLDNITSNKDPSFNSFHKKKFSANVGERLHVLFTIFNPLSINLPISSIKLIYTYIKLGGDDNNMNITESNTSVIQTTNKKLTLKGGTKQQIRLTITSEHPCIISITGVEITIYKDIFIQHLFNKRKTSILYNKKPNENCIRSTSFSDLSRDSIRRYSSDYNRETMTQFLRRTNSIRSLKHVLQINTKKEISYEMIALHNNITITCPLGDRVECYRYQCVLYPIEIENNTSMYKIKKFTVFVYCSNYKKGKVLLSLKKFYTFNIKLNPSNNKAIVYIPLYSNEIGGIDVKVVIKFKEELKRKYMEIKRFSFQVFVKASFNLFSFKTLKMVKEDNDSQCKNVYIDYCMNITIHDTNLLSEFEIKEMYPGCNITLINNESNNNDLNQWNYNIIKGKCYRMLNMLIKYYDTNVKKQNVFVEEIDPDDSHLNEHLIMKNTSTNVNSIYSDLFKSFKDTKNIIILTWTCKQIKNINNSTPQEINGFFIFDINENQYQNINTETLSHNDYLFNFELNKLIIQTLVDNTCKVTPLIKNISNDDTLIILKVNIDCQALISLNEITSFEIFVSNDINKTILDLQWMGITKHRHFLNKEDTFYTITFISKTHSKGIIPLDYIGILFSFSSAEYANLSKHIYKPKYSDICI